MNTPRFIQIHTLHSYPASLLNRDESGLAKRLPYGDAVRTRISSQCLKRHWRKTDDKFALSTLGVPMAVRSRTTLNLIRTKIMENGVSEALAQAAAEGLRAGGLLDKAKEIIGKEALATGQAVLLGYAEIEYLVRRCVELANEHHDEGALKRAINTFLKDEKNNLTALVHGSGLESALFGRMVTSDVLASRDASIYVSHAFTVHESQVENDYFTVVDDLTRESGEKGSAGIFDTELASGLYYGYTVIDVPQLIANLEGTSADWTTLPVGRRELASRVARNLLHLIATVSPGAKRGSTAPFGWAKFMLVEAGDWQPRSLAGAFHNALELGQPDLRTRAVRALVGELEMHDQAYGAPMARRFLAVDDVDVPNAHRTSLADLAIWSQNAILEGTVSTGDI